jgi:hypothetical protein
VEKVKKRMISRIVLTMPKRRSKLVLLALPVAVFLWCIGWGFYWIGQKNEKLRPAPVNKTENITFTVLLSEPKIEA